MSGSPAKITLEAWGARHAELKRHGLVEPAYGGPLGRHVAEGDLRLPRLMYDNSAAALDLWNFLLTEEDRLHEARERGDRIVGAMKDLGTVPVMAYSLPGVTAFYPDGAWWIPCVMELSEDTLGIADSLGVDESFCPVRAVLGAFVNGEHFPIPDLLVCSVGATCDDFSAVAQRLEGLGHEVLWWEMPHRRRPGPGEKAVRLPGGQEAPASQVEFVATELRRVKRALEEDAGRPLEDVALADGIREANRIRRCLRELRRLTFMSDPCPLPALELLIAEMLAIHFCSDRAEAGRVLGALLDEVKRRVKTRQGVCGGDAVKVFWVNPVADLRAMNLLENCGGRICGTENLFLHALDDIPEDVDPIEALARAALADPMVGSARERAERICNDARAFGSEALVVSRIPGASHCATEGHVIAGAVADALGIPTVEIEVPPVCDGLAAGLRTRIGAVVETAMTRRRKSR